MKHNQPIQPTPESGAADGRRSAQPFEATCKTAEWSEEK